MSRCKQLHIFLDGDILEHDEHDRLRFEAHLSECPRCADAVTQWQTIVREGRQDAAQQAYRSSAAEQISRQTIETSFARQQALSPWQKIQSRPVFAVAAVLLCLFMGAGIYWSSHLRAPEDDAFKPASNPTTVQVTGFRTDGTVYNAIKPQGAAIDATANEQLLAVVGNDRVAVAPRGKMIVQKSNPQATRLGLNQGWIACSVAKRAGGNRFVTRTFDDRYTVEVKGTRFGVQYRTTDHRHGEPIFQVAVTEGVVTVNESQMRDWTLSAGQQLAIEIDGTASVSPISQKNRNIVTSLLNPAATSTNLADALAPHKSVSVEKPPFNGNADVTPLRRKEKLSAYKKQKNKVPISTEAAPVSITEMKRWIGSGRHQEAIAAIEARLVTEPTNSELWRLLAEAKRKSRDFQGALVAYTQVIEFAPPQVANAARYKMGLLYQNQLGQPQNAIIQFSKYLSGEPTLLRAEALFHLGRAKYSAGDKTGAKNHLNEVIEKHSATAAAVKSRKLLQKMQ